MITLVVLYNFNQFKKILNGKFLVLIKLLQCHLCFNHQGKGVGGRGRSTRDQAGQLTYQWRQWERADAENVLCPHISIRVVFWRSPVAVSLLTLGQDRDPGPELQL